MSDERLRALEREARSTGQWCGYLVEAKRAGKTLADVLRETKGATINDIQTYSQEFELYQKKLQPIIEQTRACLERASINSHTREDYHEIAQAYGLIGDNERERFVRDQELAEERTRKNSYEWLGLEAYAQACNHKQEEHIRRLARIAHKGRTEEALNGVVALDGDCWARAYLTIARTILGEVPL